MKTVINKQKKGLETLERFEDFNWKKLAKVRGGAHEAIVGEWIDWWIRMDPKDHRVVNPAPYVRNRSADILFLRITTENSYYPYGVAEIENNRKMWSQKLRSLKAYEERLGPLRFLLLCTATIQGKVDEAEFGKFIQHAVGVSKTSKPKWVVYRLKYVPSKKEKFPIVLKYEWYYPYVNSGEFFIIKNGKIVQRPKQD